jgi:4-hydroxybenzoate polyprenyltransferase
LQLCGAFNGVVERCAVRRENSILPLSPLVAYARLVRLPNVFTAIADIAVGACLGGAGPTFIALGASSACLYSAGMVWNDVFDIEQDRRERPFRPLPAGHVSLAAAQWVGGILLAVGVAAACWVSLHAATLAAGLAVAILLYDRWIKRTPAAPVGMGACRFLNVLLGLSALDASIAPAELRIHLAGVVALFAAGITAFAKSEAGVSRSQSLRAAALVMSLALAMTLPLPLHVATGTASPLFPYLLVALGVVLAQSVVRAIRDPSPQHVQSAVKAAVLGIIGLDAVMATAISGPYGLLLLVLLPPAILLGRYVYST